METVTIRELRQNWPAVEKRLAAVGELAVTRDGEAVALLAPPRKPAAKQAAKRFDPFAHAKVIKKIWGHGKRSFTTGQWLAEERAERIFLRQTP
jgi:antitoxin (DNA-binding transcriptional repressor) of toxin-antitoxin stability system